MMRHPFLALLPVLLLSLGACGHDAPTDRLATTDVPGSWDGPIPQDATEWPEPNWWREFNSDELNRLIASAQSQNLDLAAATARIMQAEA